MCRQIILSHLEYKSRVPYFRNMVFTLNSFHFNLDFEQKSAVSSTQILFVLLQGLKLFPQQIPRYTYVVHGSF